MIRHALCNSIAALFLGVLSLSAEAAVDKARQPVPAATVALMAAKDMAANAPILMRTYKKEAVLEVWKQTRAGRYALLKAFPICRWSGQLGPKRKEGDRQTPEGFYSVGPKQMNPNSAYYLSFDLGFPNAFDRANGYHGAYLMVHGTCSSAGCYAMTDKQVAEIYALARDALAGGQAAFQVQAFPFRMTAENMARYRSDPSIDFWRQLKDGADYFDATQDEPRVNVENKRYTFRASTPDKEQQVAAYRAQQRERVAALVTDGSAAVRTTYEDGGQHAIFAALLKQGANLGDVSRPEALAFAGRDVVLIPARPKPKPAEPPAKVEVAAAQGVPASAALRSIEMASPFTLPLIPGSLPILPSSLVAAAQTAQAGLAP
jgi:murein L,D-transpeptidase YafK